MNAKQVFAIAALAVAATTGAQASELDPSQFALKYESSRSRAEVMTEAATVARTRSIEPAGSRVAALPKSGLDASTVRAQAASAVRLGQISFGEIGS